MTLHRLSDHKAPPAAPDSVASHPPPGWYDHGMTKAAKITVSLPREQVDQVREAVARGEAPSVSGYVSGALADALARPRPEKDEDSLAELVAELIEEHGKPSAEDYAWADKVLSLSYDD